MALPLVYNFRNLLVRRLSTGLTFAVVASLVLVLAVLLSFAAGISASLNASGSPDNVMVLRRGATAESTSILLPADVNTILAAPNIASWKNEKMLSRELSLQVSIPRVGPVGNMANVAVRAVDDVAFEVHPTVKMIRGRRFEQGKWEVIVGKAAAERFQHTQIGDHIVLGRSGNRSFEVVGIFESGGSVFESEIWGPRSAITTAYEFESNYVSSAVLRLADNKGPAETLQYINGGAVKQQARTEIDYYRELSQKTAEIVVLTSILIAIMAIGAVFAVANTMYATVDSRRREIAMLRTIGFSRVSIIISFIIESLMVCLAAALAGIGISFIVNGTKQDFFSDTTYTVLAYDLKISPGIVASSLILAVLVGIFGALAPALRASRVRVIEALRKA